MCWNRVMACGISNQYFLSFITVTWTAHSILIENNLIKNLTVKRDWELWMRLLVRIHQLGCSCTSAGPHTSAGAAAVYQLELQLYISWGAAVHQLGHRCSWGIFEGGPNISFCQNSILFCQNNILSGGANFSNSVLPS